MIQKEAKQKLFRMTSKRDIILGRASQALDSSIWSQEFKMGFLSERTNLSSHEREQLKSSVMKETERLQDAHDVLTVTRCHSQPYLVDLWFLKEREWRTEWDVPLETFERAISTMIEVLEAYKGQTNNPASRYDEPIQLLRELLAFRKEGETLNEQV